MSILISITEKLQKLLWNTNNHESLSIAEMKVNQNMLKELEDVLLNMMISPQLNVKEGEMERVLEQICEEYSKYNNYLKNKGMIDDKKDIELENLATIDELNLDPIFVTEKLFIIQEQLLNNSKDFNKLVETRKNLIDTREIIQKNILKSETVNATPHELLNTLEYINMILHEIEIEINRATQINPDKDYKLATLYQEDEYYNLHKDYKVEQQSDKKISVQMNSSYSDHNYKKHEPMPILADSSEPFWKQVSHLISEHVPIEIVLERMKKWQESIPEITVPNINSILNSKESIQMLSINLSQIALQEDEKRAVYECILVYTNTNSHILFYGRLLPLFGKNGMNNISIMALIWASLSTLYELDNLKKYINKLSYSKDSKYKIDLFYKLAYEMLKN